MGDVRPKRPVTSQSGLLCRMFRKTTGHAESSVKFRSDQLASPTFAGVCSIHGPKRHLNRQGNMAARNIGPLSDDSDAQKRRPRRDEGITDAKIWNGRLTTQANRDVFRGGREHHDYFAITRGQDYAQVVVAPKVARFRKQFTTG